MSNWRTMLAFQSFAAANSAVLLICASVQRANAVLRGARNTAWTLTRLDASHSRLTHVRSNYSYAVFAA